MAANSCDLSIGEGEVKAEVHILGYVGSLVHLKEEAIDCLWGGTPGSVTLIAHH